MCSYSLYNALKGEVPSLADNPRDTDSIPATAVDILKTALTERQQGRYPHNPLHLYSLLSGTPMPFDSGAHSAPMMDPHSHNVIGQLHYATPTQIDQLIDATRHASWHQVPIAQRVEIIEKAVHSFLYDASIIASLMASQAIATPKQDPWTELREERDDERIEQHIIRRLIESYQRGEITFDIARPKAHFLVENFANMLGLRELRYGLITGAMISIVGDNMAASHHYQMVSLFRDLLIKEGAPANILHILVTDLAGKRYFNQTSGFDTYLVGSLKTARAVKADMETLTKHSGRFVGSAQGPNMLLVGDDITYSDKQLTQIAEMAKNSGALENAGQCTQLHTIMIAPSIRQDFTEQLLAHAKHHDTQPIVDPLEVLIKEQDPFARVRSHYPANTHNPEGVRWLKPLEHQSQLNAYTYGIRVAKSGIDPRDIPENWRHPALTLYSDTDPTILTQGQKPIATGIVGHDNWTDLVESFLDVSVFSISHPTYSSTQHDTFALTYPVAARPGQGEHFREAGVSNRGPAWGNPGANEFFQPEYCQEWLLQQVPIAHEQLNDFAIQLVAWMEKYMTDDTGSETRAYYLAYMNICNQWAKEAIKGPFSVNSQFEKPDERTVVTGLSKRPFRYRITRDTSIRELALVMTIIQAAELPGHCSYDSQGLPQLLTDFIDWMQQYYPIQQQDELTFTSSIEDDGTPIICRSPSNDLRISMMHKRASIVEEDISKALPNWLMPMLGCYPRHIKTQATSPEGARQFCEDAKTLQSWVSWSFL